jgi:hypothetical protein
VYSDHEARYFGGRVEELFLVTMGVPGTQIRLADWLKSRQTMK